MNCFMFPGQPLLLGARHAADDDYSAIAGMVRERARLDLDSFSWLGNECTDARLQSICAFFNSYASR